MPRILSLAALTVLGCTPAEQVHCAAEAGFSHVGIRLVPATPTEPDPGLASQGPAWQALEQALQATGVQVLDVEIFRLRPDTQVAAFEPLLALAARLGARELLVSGHDPDAARLTDRFGALCALAARHGLGANLEFMPWTEAASLTQAARIVADCGQPNAGVLVDAFHLSRSGGRVDEVAALPRGPLRYLQLCDAPARVPDTMDEILHEARSERLFPGEGGLPLRALLREVPRDLPLSLEVPTKTLARTLPARARARRAMQATRALLESLDA